MVIEEEGFPPPSCVSRKFTGRRIDKSGVRVQLLVPLSIFSSTRYQRCPNLRPRCIYCYLICLPSPLFASTIKSFYYTFYPAFITLKLTPSSPPPPPPHPSRHVAARYKFFFSNKLLEERGEIPLEGKFKIVKRLLLKFHGRGDNGQ